MTLPWGFVTYDTIPDYTNTCMRIQCPKQKLRLHPVRCLRGGRHVRSGMRAPARRCGRVPVTLVTRAADIATFCFMAYLPTDTPQVPGSLLLLP